MSSLSFQYSITLITSGLWHQDGVQFDDTKMEYNSMYNYCNMGKKIVSCVCNIIRYSVLTTHKFKLGLGYKTGMIYTQNSVKFQYFFWIFEWELLSIEQWKVSCQDIKVLNKLSCQFEHFTVSVNMSIISMVVFWRIKFLLQLYKEIKIN